MKMHKKIIVDIKKINSPILKEKLSVGHKTAIVRNKAMKPDVTNGE